MSKKIVDHWGGKADTSGPNPVEGSMGPSRAEVWGAMKAIIGRMGDEQRRRMTRTTNLMKRVFANCWVLPNSWDGMYSAKRSLSPGAPDGVDPQAYLADVLIRMQSHPQKKIDELLPHRWQPP